MRFATSENLHSLPLFTQARHAGLVRSHCTMVQCFPLITETVMCNAVMYLCLTINAFSAREGWLVPLLLLLWGRFAVDGGRSVSLRHDVCSAFRANDLLRTLRAQLGIWVEMFLMMMRALATGIKEEQDENLQFVVWSLSRLRLRGIEREETVADPDVDRSPQKSYGMPDEEAEYLAFVDILFERCRRASDFG
jgi:hypothetical protein